MLCWAPVVMEPVLCSEDFFLTPGFEEWPAGGEADPLIRLGDFSGLGTT